MSADEIMWECEIEKKLYSKPGCQFWYLYNYINCTRWNILWNRNKFLNVIRLGGEAFTRLRQFLTYRAATITLTKTVVRVIVAAR